MARLASFTGVVASRFRWRGWRSLDDGRQCSGAGRQRAVTRHPTGPVRPDRVRHGARSPPLAPSAEQPLAAVRRCRAASSGRARRRLLLALSTLLPLAAAAAPPLPPPNVEALMEIRSYGERPRDLLALIVPLLGQRQFAPDSRRRAEVKAEGGETFAHAGGDFVVTAGRYNCIVVAYYTGSGRGTAIRKGARERAEAFRLALWDFLDALPTPRPTIREITWGSKYCSDGG
jgi:transposase InsO family protein